MFKITACTGCQVYDFGLNGTGQQAPIKWTGTVPVWMPNA